MTREEFVAKVEKIYDQSKEVIDAGDEEKMTGKLILLGTKANDGDLEAVLEVSIFTYILSKEPS